MSYRKGPIALLLLVMACALSWRFAAAAAYSLPELPAPALYGNLLIDRIATQHGATPVSFSHWTHRTRFTCRVCHTELEFDMAAGTTEISCDDIKQGRYCGACHNGKLAFGQQENCQYCHNGDLGFRSEEFAAFSQDLAPDEFGNQIDWSEMMRRGQVQPQTYLEEAPLSASFEKVLSLEAAWGRIPPAVFPHKEHNQWVDCDTCHPDLFNIKQKTTAHFAMNRILKGEFCGYCHMKVAFPMDACERCHPGMSR